MLIILLKAEQLGLFDMPVRVSGSVDKRGVVRKPHVRIQKVRPKQAGLFDEAPKRDDTDSLDRRVGKRLAAFLRRHGGIDGFARTLAGLTEGQQQALFGSMAKLAGKPVAEIAALFDGVKPAAEKPAAASDKPAEPAKVKWFGSREKAEAWIARKKLAETHEVVKVGRRFEIHEKAAPAGSPAPADAAPAAAIQAADKPGIDYSLPFDAITVPSFGVPAGTSKAERKRLNAEAIKLLEKSEHTEAERRILAQYSGNGGVGDSLNEFYTDPAVAAAMWKTLRSLGVEGGEVLEPSCATGVFLATAPAGVRVTGVELDPTSAKIANILHGGRHEIRTASLERFATNDERQFDAVIGNAPFGLRGALIRDDKPELKTAEQYFLDTALDKTRPGGVVAMIVPTGILDGKNNRAFRERLLRKAEFLGAQRMPNTAFEHAHTGVTTDIIYLRKRPDDVAGALMTVDQDTLKALGVWDEEFLAGRYFAGRGADNVFGTMEEGWRAKAGIGDDITVTGSMVGVPAAIAKGLPDVPAAAGPDMAAILDALGDDEEAKARALGGAAKRPYTYRIGDTKIIDGVTYVLQGEPPRWHRVDELVDTEAVHAATELAEQIERLMQGQAVDRPKLEADIRAFVEKHGIPAKHKDLLLAAKQDKVLHRLLGAVDLSGRLSDLVTGKARQIEGGFDAVATALALERDSRDFTAAELAERLGREPEEVEDQLLADARYAITADGRWTPMSDYLTGELWPKLDAVQEARKAGDLAPGLAEKYATQERLLLETIDPKSLEDVEIALNSAFIPLDVISAFFNWKQYESEDANDWTKKLPPVEISFEGGVYTITGGNQSGELKLIDKYLNRTGVRKDDLPIIERLNEEFKDWLTGSRYRDQVEELYNRSFRGFKPVAFSDAPIDVPGLANHDQIKDYQWPGLRWALANGKGIIAADVGLGKTLRGLLLARMAQINGQAQKPMIVVPKSVLANWAAEIEKWFPGSKVLVLGATFTRTEDGELKGKDDGPAERARKLHDLTQNHYDFILCAESVYQEVDLSPELKARYAGEDFWVQRGDRLRHAGDKRARRVREQYEQSIAGRDFEKRTDAIYFDDLGVDMIIRDEGHREKNLWAARNRFGETPKFLGGQGESQRAYDFYLKSKYIRERNGGKNVYMLTATPTKNSPLEIYSMLSHIAPEAFERIGIRNAEEFLDRFCVFENDRIYTLEGTFEDALVTAGFKNLNELREIMSRYIDRKTAEDVGLELPKRDDRMHYLDMSDAQREVYAELRQRLVDSKDSDEATGDAHIFAIMSDMAKAAMDLELYDSKYAGQPSPKYEAVAKNAVDLSKDGGQVIFADYIGAHEKIRDALIALGVPKSQIAIVNAKVAGSAARRQNIAEAFNAGKIKYVIGNTATMGEGMNLQRLTADIHHLDLPWEPASLQQRNGRGLRQGNLNEAVRIHTYISKGTFDGYRYQSMARKRDWQDLLWNGGDRVENLAREGALTHDDLAIMVAEDPDAAAKAHAENKQLATQRYEAEQRAAAAQAFSRYQDLKASYARLKNKDSDSARRLKARIDRARVQLEANKYFKAKAALDAQGPVVIHPATGDMLTAGQGFELPKGGSGGLAEGGRFVVTGVRPLKSKAMVSVRRYGVPNASEMTVSLDEFGKAKPFAYDAAAETKEIERKLAEQAEASVDTVNHPAALRGLPKEVMSKHYATIQDKLKTALKEYKWSPPGGYFSSNPIGFIDPEGRAVFRPSYDARTAADSMDVLLPTEEHREKAMQAWMAAERGKRFRHDYVQNRRGGRSTAILKQAYADEKGSYWGEYATNPWSNIGDEVFGPGFEQEARDRFYRAQFERARRADSFGTALKELAPTIDYSYSGAKWPKRTLAILWAKAKRDGLLDRKFGEALKEIKHDSENSWERNPVLPAEMIRTDSHTYTDPTVHAGLAALAAKNNHYDLAAAMLTSGAKNESDAVEAIRMIAGFSWQDKWDAVQHLVEKHNLADRRPSEFNLHHRLGSYGQMTFSELVARNRDRRAA